MDAKSEEVVYTGCAYLTQRYFCAKPGHGGDATEGVKWGR
jgi:hypothetical protein